ncbi:hypothetical protein ACJ41O_011955 [Fusarium nematophilum]
MRQSMSFAASIALFALATAQSGPEDLASALSDYPSLSLFRSLLTAAPEGLNNTLSEQPEDVTVLVPTNDAIQEYLSAAGVTDISDIKADDLQVFFSYHVMAASLKAADFDDPKGKVVPTMLKDKEFNQRAAGPQIKQEYGNSATGQVVFATRSEDNGTSNKVKRQDDVTGPNVGLRAGLAQDVQMTAVDGSWGAKKANSFQVVDQVLAPPRPCSTTVRRVDDKRLHGLDTALIRAGLWPALDASNNVTCLAPSTEAFKAAGNPQNSLPEKELAGALLAHTLKEVTYTNFLTDGQVVATLNDTKVTVHLKGDDIYFNNAKVIKPNVLTNNGLIHILDAIIEPENDSEETGTTSVTSTPTATGTSGSNAATSTEATPSQATTNAANPLSVGYSGLVGLIAGLVMI